jgi:TatD DNase family protein
MKAMDFIDSHAHLEFPQFDEDRDAVLARARAAGVETILAVGSGSGPARLDAAIPMAGQHDWIFATVGIHPHEARLATDEHFVRLDELARHARVIAWGEIGLDYYYDYSPREAQVAIFRRQLELARSEGLPIVIHCREAWPDCLRILEEDWRSSGLGGILHCFSGTLDDARRGIEMGFRISFAANITYPKSQPLREVAYELPLDSLLIETDSPFLAPQIRGKRARRNEPAYVVEVARTIANVRNLSLDEIAAATSENFRTFFFAEGQKGAPGSARQRAEGDQPSRL